jgi:transketolase
MRLTRNKVPAVHGEGSRFQLGKGEVLRPGHDVAIAACGSMVEQALQAHDLLRAQGVQAQVLNLSTIKPLDAELLERAARECGCVVTAEDHNVLGGLGGAVCEALASAWPVPVERVGVRDVFGESGRPEELYEKYGLTGRHVAEAARRAMARKAR